MSDFSYVSVAEAQSLLLDFACLLHVERAEISELRTAKVSDWRILNLYPFNAADYQFAIKCQMDYPVLAEEVRAAARRADTYGSVARYLPVGERRLTRAQARAYDAELERLRAFAKQFDTAVLPLEDHAQAVYEVLLSLTVLDCLTRQPFIVSIDCTEGEQDALNLGLPAWWNSIRKLLPKVQRRAEALSSR